MRNLPDFLKTVVFDLILPLKKARNPAEKLPPNHNKRLREATAAQHLEILFDLLRHHIMFNTQEILISEEEKEEDLANL